MWLLNSVNGSKKVLYLGNLPLLPFFAFVACYTENFIVYFTKEITTLMYE